jgi:hypothetical protein
VNSYVKIFDIVVFHPFSKYKNCYYQRYSYYDKIEIYTNINWSELFTMTKTVELVSSAPKMRASALISYLPQF